MGKTTVEEDVERVWAELLAVSGGRRIEQFALHHDYQLPAVAKARQAGFNEWAEQFQAKLVEALAKWADDYSEKRALVLTGDYSTLEARVLATLLHESGGVLSLEDEGCVPGLYDFVGSLRPKQSATKQNGRSASYLALDPTKNHRRRPHRGKGR